LRSGPLQHDRRTAIDDPLTELPDHGPSVVLVDVKLLGDLQSREGSRSHPGKAENKGLPSVRAAKIDHIEPSSPFKVLDF